MVCHDMEIVLDFAQRVLVLAEGRLIADRRRGRFFKWKRFSGGFASTASDCRLAARFGFDDVFMLMK